ncbi:acyltransferase family protein [Thermomonospora cellulosilytica]|uniref:Peptidoglycan/LPS O-acetylase OafA/YrhL n=1 Tax=Thermomonospora cellulosilytica TaxID=1411118 RepID=A0A7W3RCX8_9ACTN|nr:acyltransferase [Thermomonospora cellulosilytica]MBA9007755.1 peptidoglycan/LPS O-acetylase OafA/YrhL [Thermomonospora cellulosilytica]
MHVTAQPRSHAGPAESHLPSLTGALIIVVTTMFLARVMFTPIFESRLFQMIPDKGAVAVVFWQGASAATSYLFLFSGFALAWSVRPGEKARRFWWRRFLELYPTHLVTLVAAIVLFTFVPMFPVDYGVAVLNGALLHAWFPQLEIWTSFNSSSWVVSCEALFALCFPVLMALIGRIRPERLWAWTGGVVAVIYLVPLAATALPDHLAAPYPGHEFTQVPDSQFWFVTKFPPVRMLEFILGILLARIVRTGRRLPLGVGGATLLLVVSYAVAPLFPLTYPMVAVMAVPMGLVIAALAAADGTGRRSWLNSRVMVWLGGVSWAFYLWSLLVLNAGVALLDGGFGVPAGIAVVALLLGITLLLSWLQCTLIQRPIMRRFAAPRRHRDADPGLVPAGSDGPRT